MKTIFHHSKCVQIKMVVSIIILTSVIVFGETVHFTNSQSQLERSLNTYYGARGLKTYQLEVPGSSPITIIEAEPKGGDRGAKSSLIKNAEEDFTGRKTKDYLVPGSTHEKDSTRSLIKEKDSRRCFGSSCDEYHSDGTKKTVYSPELLNNFLKEYAEKIKNADQKIKDRLKQMEITTPKAGIIVKQKISDKMDFQDDHDDSRRYSSWGEVDTKKHKHPYDDSEGWVALEAVPWTRSKISKWQANAYKISKPNHNFNSFGGDKDSPHISDRYSPNYGKPDLETSYESKPPDSFHHSHHAGSYGNRPSYETSQSDNDWFGETPSRPSWDKPTYNRPAQYPTEPEHRPHHRPDCEHNHQDNYYDDDNRRLSNKYSDQGGIITDGRPGDFPTAGNSYELKNIRRPTEVVYANVPRSEHPLSHPANGNGQWVLLSTTKGYKIPKNRQRSLSITPNAITSHRSVRLTVLPAVNGSKENMTLSHGGMLEVEPSFQTVDESRRLFQRSQNNINSTTSNLRPKKIRRVLATNATPDSSAVMAAVGAGLVPATVAMIMPMVLGRKKRSVIRKRPINSANFAIVTQYPHLDFESTLQRSF